MEGRSRMYWDVGEGCACQEWIVPLPQPDYIHCPVRKQETSLLTQRPLFRTTLIVMVNPRDVHTGQFQMVTVMNDKNKAASPLYTSPHISTSYV